MEVSSAAEPTMLGSPPASSSSEATTTSGARDLVAEATKVLLSDEDKVDTSDPQTETTNAGQEPLVAETKDEAPSEPKGSVSSLIRQRAELDSQRKALEAERAKWQSDQKDALARMQAMERAYAAFEADPVAFVKTAGVKRPLDEIARDLWIEQNAEALTPEQRALHVEQRERQQIRRELEQLKAERAQVQARQLLQTYRSDLVSGFADIAENTPIIREMAAKRPQAVADQMLAVADRLARERPDLGVLTAKQIAEILEPSLASELEAVEGYFERKYAAKAKPTAPTPPVTTQSSLPPTLKATHTTQTSVRRQPTTEEERIAAAVRALEGRA